MASSRKPPRSNAPPGASPVEDALAAALARSSVKGAGVCVALSGGIDSVVLLHALRVAAARHAVRLSAIHVNHGLSPNARRWEAFCRALCERLRIPLAVRRVKVERRGRGVEAAARAARYAALAASKADVVALAHQLDDQAETVLFNLLRGGGLAGASGMAECGPLHGSTTIRALRPLLGTAREEIEVYARKHELDWVEDESNADEMLTRNWVRRRVAPLLAARFPRWREGLARAAAHFAEAQGLLSAGAPERLHVSTLERAPRAKAKILLRDFLRGAGVRAPTARRLDEMLRQLLEAPADARVEFGHDGLVLHRFRGEVRLGPATGSSGEVTYRQAAGEGIDAEKFRAGPVTVRSRHGGERMRLAANRPSRTLKNLFQEAGVPPWERDRLPLVYCGEDLVWVPGVGIAAGYRAGRGRPGLVPEWGPETRGRPRE